LITWEAYLQLYCIFEAGKMEKSALIKFWERFFDKGLKGSVPKEEYMTTLEELVRGNTLRKPSKTTTLFAKMFQKMMKQADCLDDKEAIVNEKLSKAFERDAIDIQLLCSALGR